MDAFTELKQYLAEMEFDRVAVFLYSDEEGTPAAEFSKKVARRTMESRRAELMEIQDRIALRKSGDRVGEVMDVLVEGVSEETDLLLEARHEGMAPEIDGVVYINDVMTDLTHLPQARHDASLPVPGDFVKVRITEASTYDLVGHIIG